MRWFQLILSALSGFAGRNVTADGGTFWLPRPLSDAARRVDAAWDLVFGISLFFFVLVSFLMFLFLVRYRRSAGRTTDLGAPSHNTKLEVFWSVIPTLLVVVLFWQGYRTYLYMATAPQNAYEILVTAQKWNWLFTYPNGYVDAKLHVPVDTPVRLVMSSQDVLHSFYVPELRVKRDVIPGRYTYVWFDADRVGEYDIFCAEYCGTSHSNMLSTLVVHERADYEAWLADASDFLSKMPPAEAGALLYQQRGCKQCHSVDGSSGIAPTFLNLYGRSEMLTNGLSVEVDENYIRESIYEPLAKVTAGYDPVMPTYRGRLSDAEVTAIIEYLKTLR